MAARAATMAVGGLGACYLMSAMFTAKTAQAEALTPDQKRTLRIRSHMSGHYPSVAGGEDCHSRKTGMLKSNVSSGCTLTEHTTDKRKAIDGTVSHH